MKKKFILLFFVMTVFTLILSVINVQAATITELKNKFPSGTYWNHPNGGNNPDGYSNKPCSHHIVDDSQCGLYANNCACNSFSNAIQCHGFGLKLGNDYYGQSPRNWAQIYNLSSLKAGDIVRFNNGGVPHTIWVTSVNGNSVTYADCNSDNRCKIRWNQTISKSVLSGNLTYVLSAPYPAVDNDDSRSCWRITAGEGVNIRDGAGTGYNIVGALAYNTHFYITERRQADDYTWGRTDGGWVVLDYAVHVSGPIPEIKNDTVPAIHKDENPHVRNGYCTIKNVASGKFMNVYAGSDANYTSVCMWAYDDSTDQHFRLDHKGGGKYKLYAYCSNRGTNRVVDVNRGTDAPAEGDKIQLWTPDDDTSQLYYPYPVGNDEYVFELASKNGYVLAPNGGGDANADGAQLILQRYTGAAHQKWCFCDNNGQVRNNNVSYTPGYYTVNTNGTPIVRRKAADPFAEVLSGHDINDKETVYVSQVNNFWGYTEHAGIGGWICLDYTKSTVVLESISISSMPDKTSYFVGEKFDTLGLKITANYSNGQKEELSNGFSVSCNIDQPGTKQATVTYKDKTASFDVNVQNVSVSEVTVQENNIKKIYTIGDTLDTTGLSLLVEYNNGTTDIIDSGYTTDYDFSAAGTKTVTVAYGGKSTSYAVTVTEPTTSEKASVSVASTDCEAGGNAVVYISLSGNNIYDGNMTIQYDSSKLTLTDAKACDALSGRMVSINPNYAADKVRVSFSGTDMIKSEADILRLEFTASTSEGTANIAVSEARLYDLSANTIEATLGTGSVNIYPAVSAVEISNVQSEIVNGIKVLTANTNNDNIVCYLAAYDNGKLVECDVQEPESGNIKLSVSDGYQTKFMVWSRAMKPLMNPKTIY